METQRYPELELDSELHRQITELRNQCFPDHAVPRSYYKQMPHFRELIHNGKHLIAHVGLDYRTISVGGVSISILGVIDLCVDPDHRSLGLGGQLIKSVIELGQAKQVDFILLAADDQRLYHDNGFGAISADCSWLKIDEFKNYGIAKQRLENVLMIHKVGEKDWPVGPVDMLGYLF
ncbi:MAG: GNAT family N-acetyltransferase [Planctomycetota bacterium]|nr:GNAT family N-acetyltransferase [Planctomycetota bacterium]